MTKRVLIPWSGGMDSTYLIKWYSDKGYDVYTGYINLVNNGLKSVIEQNTIEKLLPLMEKYRMYHLDTLFTINIVKTQSNSLSLSQPLLWLTPLAYNSSFYDEVAIGYVMGDCAVSYLNDFQNIWESFKGLSPFPDRWPELKFPLIKMKKDFIWQQLDDDIRKLCVWCENPIDDEILGYKICNDCVPCKRRITEKIGKLA